MGFTKIRWRIAVPYLVLILAVMLGVMLFVSDLVRRVHIDGLEARMVSEARLVGEALRPTLIVDGDGVQRAVDAYARSVGSRVTVVATNGVVWADSQENAAQMDNHLYRPEVQEALSFDEGMSIRYSETLGYEMMYVATRLGDGDETLGIVRMALPLAQVRNDVARLRQSIYWATLIAALAALALSVVIAARTVRPVRQLTDVVQRTAAGDLSARLMPTTQDEVGTLTMAFNEMAESLSETVSSLERARTQTEAVLEHMADGVLITDGEGDVQLINRMALDLFGTTRERSMGHSLAQVARHHEMISAWRRCFESGQEQTELVEDQPGGPFLQMIVTQLPTLGERACLVVLQDLTHVRQMEVARRELVGNVSHELRTPLAGLKSLVETLREGAIEDPPAAERFLSRMDGEVDILTQMVEELLELSRIESGRVPLRLISMSVHDAVLPAVERLQPQVERAGLSIDIDLPQGLPAVLGDPGRMQQVVANLLHNAIKFTPEGGIAISARADQDQVIVSVSDTGVGISQDDLPRIFERFYKADRARSEQGTGLGLAIAKHIVQACGGSVWAENNAERGSTFSISLLVAETAEAGTQVTAS